MALIDDIKYLPTTKITDIIIKPREINKNLERTILNKLEKTYNGQITKIGYIRPGSISIKDRSVCHTKLNSDLGGLFRCNVKFECETYIPKEGEVIEVRIINVNSAVGVSCKSDNGIIQMILINNLPSGSNDPEQLSQLNINQRIRAEITDQIEVTYDDDDKKNKYMILGKLVDVLEGVYQNYYLPTYNLMSSEIQVTFSLTDDIKNIYVDYNFFLKSIGSKSLIDAYDLIKPSNLPYKELISNVRTNKWYLFKDYWNLAKSLVEMYELVYPPGNYNKKQGVALLSNNSVAINRAYFKMWELLHRYPETINKLDTTDTGLTILALAEGPGGFIQALSHYLDKIGSPKATFYGYTIDTPQSPHLKWDHKVAVDERKKSKHKYYLKYGDLTLKSTIESIMDDLKNVGKVDLVMCDGAIEGINTIYNYEEVVNYRLFAGEIITAIINQKPGGTLIIKMFDLLTHVTKQLLLLLNNYYNTIHISKPDFSRPASSEKYIICLNFKGLNIDEQNENESINRLLTLMEKWTDQNPNESLDIYYPLNELFFMKILDYTIPDNNEFNIKLNEVNNDHLKRQNEHISKGVHLIHTKKILDKNVIKKIKLEQLEESKKWCATYGLNVKNRIDLSEEINMGGQITNTKSLKFGLNKLYATDKETFDYLQTNYSYLSLTYLDNQFNVIRYRTIEMINNKSAADLYILKRNFINPFMSNNKLVNMRNNHNYGSLRPSLDWYIAYELLYPLLNEITNKKLNVLCYNDLQTGGFVSALDDISDKFEIKTEWNILQTDVDENKLSYETDNYGLYNEHRDQILLKDFKKGEFMLEVIEKHNNYDLILNNTNIKLSDYEEDLHKDNISQILMTCMTLKNGGVYIHKQSTYFSKFSQSLMIILYNLFGKIDIVKPLADYQESPVIYLICKDFNKKEFTDTLKNHLFDLLENTDDQQLKSYIDGYDMKDYEDLRTRMIYIGHKLYILSVIPKLQINMDLYKNPTYKLNNLQEKTFQQLDINKQNRAIAYEKRKNDDIKQEIDSLNKQIEDLYVNVKQIVMKDFGYIYDEIADNWLKLFK